MTIHTLIKKQLMGTISPEEEQLLEEWIAHHPDEKGKYEQLLDNTQLADRYMQYEKVDAEKAWERLRTRIQAEQQEQPVPEETQTYHLTILRAPVMLRIAAVIVLLIVGGTFWYHRSYTHTTPPVITEQVQRAMLQSRESGMQGAEVINARTGHQEIISQEQLASYHVDDNFVEQLTNATRITTYHNKEYWTTLNDGTLVHLNYNSRLIYPEKFGDRRDVILEGEAYFMVAKDKHRQFVVHTPQGDITVYGTEFYVKTDTGKTIGDSHGQRMEVVLLKGSISFTPVDGKELPMQPGQQLCVADKQLTIRYVDTAPYTAWNEGKFLFEAWSLERVMNVLSHWYDIEVQFASDDLKDKQIDGYFDRYDTIDSILESIETVLGVKITKRDRYITIN